jgi:hypothetical protein
MDFEKNREKVKADKIAAEKKAIADAATEEDQTYNSKR